MVHGGRIQGVREEKTRGDQTDDRSRTRPARISLLRRRPARRHAFQPARRGNAIRRSCRSATRTSSNGRAPPDGRTASPDGWTASPDGRTASTNGRTASPDGRTTSANGGTASPNGWSTTSDGRTAPTDGSASSTDGSTNSSNGTGADS